MRLPRRHIPILIVLLAVVAAAAASMVEHRITSAQPESGPLPGEWTLPCYDSHATSYDPVASSPVAQPYRLSLERTLAVRPSNDSSRGLMFLATDMPGAREASILAAENQATAGRDVVSTVAWPTLDAREPVRVCDGRLMAAFRTSRERQLRLLCWNLSIRYEPAGAGSRLVPSDLFILNYSREANFPQPLCFSSALHHAARRESLHVDNVLEMVTADGTVVARTRLDPSYNPTTAAIVRLRDRDIALVGFNSGYQVSESLYRELTLPRLGSRQRGFEAPRATTRSYGSFRGLLAVDLESGDVLWERRLGVTPIHSVAYADIDGDGLTEIVLSVYSPANGISARGTTDLAAAYVLCLDADGNELWRHRICGLFLGVVIGIGNVVGDQELEVVAVSVSSMNPDSGEVVVLDGRGVLLAGTGVTGNAGGLVLVDLDDDGLDEILTSDTHGRLIAFDGRLDFANECVGGLHPGYDRERLTPVAANDVDGDGVIEVVALSTGWTMNEWSATISGGQLEKDTLSYLVALDCDLSVEARARIPGPGGWGRGPGRERCMTVDIDGDGTNEIVIVLDGVGAEVFKVVPAQDDEVALSPRTRKMSE